MLRGDSPLVATVFCQSSRILKFADLYAAVADEIFVILEKDVPFFRQAEILDFRVFAAGDQGVVDIRASLIFDDFESIEPVLDRAIELRNDAAMIPLSDMERNIPSIHIPVRWNQIVQRCGSSVSDDAF